ncbi:MAG TPA: MBL fold metallo-hydrolase [Thermoanaerobaculia bacterium]|jgi:glyoxylase-like metal-dependent hydrolase (beta-lactamase superfamily II)
MKLLRLLALCTLALPLFANQLASNRKGLALLEKSLAAHGGRQDDLRASLIVRSDFVNEQQSLGALEPFETYPLTVEIKIDQPAKRIRLASDSSIAGDFRFRDVTVLENGKGFSLTPDVMTWRENTQEPANLLNRYFPHRYVVQALANRASVRSAGEHAITYASPSGAHLTLHFDPRTSLLTKLEQLLSMGSAGDAFREVTYGPYRKSGKLLLPTTISIRSDNAVYGKVTNVYRYESVSDAPLFTAEELKIPEGYTKGDYSYRGNFAVKTLAPDVYLFENITSSTGQWSYNVMAVVFDEYVLVSEAPIGSAVTEQVLAKVRELAPNKPVRYLVQSHHHGDHLGGIRGYVAEGTTIVTGATAKPLIEKIAAAPSLLDPDRQQREPRKPLFDPVAESKTFRDARHEVVVYNIGPAPHAKDMLIVWLPKERILYQADLINDGEYPDNEGTRHLFAKLRELGIEPKTIAGLHGRVRSF